jgi:ABC-type branched-subunit amino acid transport system substrate-binding protein
MVQARGRLLAVAIAVVLVAAVACSSSSSSKSGNGGGGGGGGAGKTFTVGILTDLTGPAASGNLTVVQGVRAGVLFAARQGYNVKFVVGDTQTSPTGALSAAQKMVEQDHVFAVIAHSALAFTATTYLTSHNVPVIGVAEDGTEWQTSKNMFSVYGAVHPEAVSTTDGEFFKSQGVTTVGALGYSISPSSSEAAQGAAKSSQAVGLKVGYVDAAFPFGSTNVQPIALAMRNAGVDGFTATVDPNTGFALITALRQAGANLKVALLPTGYGGDLLQAGPGALQEAQNVYFTLTYEPVEMHTAATQQLESDLKAAGVTTEPTYAEYNGYLSIALLVKGLQAAGSSPTQASLISALSAIHDWDAEGLVGSHHIDINNRTTSGMTNCVWVTKLTGSTFQLVPGADPICGHLVPGETVSPAS